MKEDLGYLKPDPNQVRQRKRIMECDRSLRLLNELYPGERKKAVMDSEFERLRTDILSERRYLSAIRSQRRTLPSWCW